MVVLTASLARVHIDYVLRAAVAVPSSAEIIAAFSACADGLPRMEIAD